MNSWNITGRMGDEPRLAATRDGTAVLNLRVAVDQRVKRDGAWVTDTIWVDVTMFGTRAEPLSRMLRKGGRVGASGRLGLRHYEARDGTQKTALELVAEDIEPLDSKPQDGAQAPAQRPAAASYGAANAAAYGGAHRDELAGQQTRGGAAARGQQDLGARARAADGAYDYALPPDAIDDIPF